MKLIQILLSQKAWGSIFTQRLPIDIAEAVFMYQKAIAEKVAFIEQERVKILREVSGVTEGVPDLARGTPESAKADRRFNEMLEGDSKLEPIPLKWSELMAGLKAHKGNTVTPQDLDVAEPFFQPAG
jgi:hypothetical protein